VKPLLKLDSESSGDEYSMYFDGSTTSKNGYFESACAFVIQRGEKDIFSTGVYLGEAKSNGAEFMGLLYGLLTCLHLGIGRLQVLGDS
jgi:ribonuclease HI